MRRLHDSDRSGFWLLASLSALSWLLIFFKVHEPAIASDALPKPDFMTALKGFGSLLLLPHTLETSADPHATLREAARVLVPEGRALIFGLHPWSIWGAQHALECPRGLNAAKALSYFRLRDWLQLLQLEIVAVDFGCHGVALEAARWQQYLHWLDALGERAWPVLGGAYCVLVAKRVQGVHLLGPSWRRQAVSAQAATAPVRKHLGKKT